jgi:purine nucleosidase
MAAVSFNAAAQSAPRLVAPRLVLIDQDGSGPAGSNQMSMMVLLQSPKVKVLGITMVSGNAWEPEEVRHTLRMLELIGRTDVPVVPGAIFPLVRTEQESTMEQAQIGSFPWYGAWGDLAAHTSMQPYHGPFVLPPLEEGEPSTKPLDEDAAHFLIRQVHAHPHQVTIYAAGPLTNLALALSIDPHFAELTQGIALMGGSLAPATADPEFATDPRHEFNFWFDPEAAHIVLRAAWPRIDLTPVDISVKTHFTKAMHDQIAAAHTPAAQYVAKYTREYSYLWDELEAAALLDPGVITKEEVLYIDVDTQRGPNYGDTLSWIAAKPAKVHVAAGPRAGRSRPGKVRRNVRGIDECAAAKTVESNPGDHREPRASQPRIMLRHQEANHGMSGVR